MPLNKLAQINGQVQTFKRMNRILYDNWQDRAAEVFREGCTGKIEKEWDSIYNEVEQLLRQLRQMKQRIEELNRQSKRH